MQQNVLFSLASMFVLGIGAYWLAWRLRIPAILLLLLAGFSAGPGTEWMTQQGWISQRFLDPDRLFGDLLLPVVSLSVAVILFEGALTLNMRELTQVGRIVGLMVSVGAVVMGAVTSLAAHYALGLNWSVSVLIGAILIVTGPTVIGPLLRHVRPFGQVGPILKWEGIVIDPIGAMLAVLVFEVIVSGGGRQLLPHHFAWGILKTMLIGGAIGAAGAGTLVLLLKRFLVPDFMQNAVALMLVVAGFALSNLLQHESGLFAVTLMGIIVANQRLVNVQHIAEFKENLTILLISGLFVLMGSRLRLEQLEAIGWRHGVFLAVLILIGRPLAVFASTWKSGLAWNEKLFLSGMAPRGVVAAAVASVFALRLREEGHEGSGEIVPTVFAVIIGTVTVYGLGARHLAKWLSLAKPSRLGFLIAGANPLAQAIASALQREQFQVLLVDTNRPNVQSARSAGLPVYYGSIQSQHVVERIELTGIGRLLALTPSEEVNSLAALHFTSLFGRAEVYELPSAAREGTRKENIASELRGRILFGDKSYTDLERLLREGYVVRRTKLTGEFGYEDLKRQVDGKLVPLFLLSGDGSLTIYTADRKPTPKPGQVLISLAKPAGESNPAQASTGTLAPANPT